MLSETGTVVLKFMLHISFEEQAGACRSAWTTRPNTGNSAWATWTPANSGQPTRKPTKPCWVPPAPLWAPWTVVPSDSKTHRNLMIATLVRDTLKSLDLRYPPSDPALKGLRID
jgi:hypothetical protein